MSVISMERKSRKCCWFVLTIDELPAIDTLSPNVNGAADVVDVDVDVVVALSASNFTSNSTFGVESVVAPVDGNANE